MASWDIGRIADIRNFRIPALDLDSVYGGGPVASPHLYDRTVDRGPDHAAD